MNLLSNTIMMLMKFADLSQPDRSHWIMWQVKDPSTLGGTGVWRGKNSFHIKCKNFDNIVVYFITSLKSKWKIK